MPREVFGVAILLPTAIFRDGVADPFHALL